jgi:hypothetical protein
VRQRRRGVLIGEPRLDVEIRDLEECAILFDEPTVCGAEELHARHYIRRIRRAEYNAGTYRASLS